MMNGPMLQALLENRFRLKIHRETKEVPVYTLTVSKAGPPLQPFQGSCIPWDYDNPPAIRRLLRSGVETHNAQATGLNSTLRR